MCEFFGEIQLSLMEGNIYKVSSKALWTVCIMEKQCLDFKIFLHQNKAIPSFHFPQTLKSPHRDHWYLMDQWLSQGPSPSCVGFCPPEPSRGSTVKHITELLRPPRPRHIHSALETLNAGAC